MSEIVIKAHGHANEGIYTKEEMKSVTRFSVQESGLSKREKIIMRNFSMSAIDVGWEFPDQDPVWLAQVFQKSCVKELTGLMVRIVLEDQ